MPESRPFVIRTLISASVVAVLLVGVAFVALPAWGARNEVAHQQPAQVEVGVPPTPAEAGAAQTAPSFVTSGPPRPTAAPTLTPIAQTIVTTGAAAAPTSAGTESPLSLEASIAAETSLAAPTAEQTAEIGRAYAGFIDVTSEARLRLDTARLADVASGDELNSLRREIDQDRALGRARQIQLEHLQVIVLGVQNDRADVADRFRDNSRYVDPATPPLVSGQAAAGSGGVAPVVNIVYHLQRTDGTWKVVSGIPK